MAKSSMGYWAFLIAILIAVATGFMTTNIYLPILMLGLGVIVAMLNIDAKETEMFLLWIIALGVIGIGSLATGLGAIPNIGGILQNILTNIGSLFTTIAAAFLVIVGAKILHK